MRAFILSVIGIILVVGSFLLIRSSYNYIKNISKNKTNTVVTATATPSPKTKTKTTLVSKPFTLNSDLDALFEYNNLPARLRFYQDYTVVAKTSVYQYN